MSSLLKLSDEELTNAYIKAVLFNLDSLFINLLKSEFERRGLEMPEVVCNNR